MLLRSGANRPSLKTIRRIKCALREALQLSDDVMVTVTQLACLEDGCAPLETVIGLLWPGEPQRQHTIHKQTEAVDADDLITVCEAWGYTVKATDIYKRFKEN